MQIITLTTDFGSQDLYVAMLKGSIISAQPHVNFIDLTHNIKNFNIVQAAYSVKYTYREFPAGTIHIVSVHNFYTPHPKYLVIKHEEHYFIGPDNGVFSLAFEQKPLECYEIPCESYSILSYKDAFTYAVDYLMKGLSIDGLGKNCSEIIERFSLQAITGERMIRGTVIHIDHYENVILNITKDLWDRYSYYHRFALFFKRHDPITQLSTSYADVAIGENLCLFNSANHLEIAINMGTASSMLSLELEDAIQIEFY